MRVDLRGLWNSAALLVMPPFCGDSMCLGSAAPVVLVTSSIGARTPMTDIVVCGCGLWWVRSWMRVFSDGDAPFL